MTFIGSCGLITTYEATVRDADKCQYCTVDPNEGSVKDAVKCNLENFYVNEPHCERTMDDLGIE